MVRPLPSADADAIMVWDDLLRAYAETIEQQRSYLLSIGAAPLDPMDLVPPSFDVPDNTPIMPTAYADWATSLVHETEGLAELAAQILADRPPSATELVRRSVISGTAGGSMMDQKL
jgi:hypothetical protein